MKRKHRAIVQTYKAATVGDIRSNTRASLPCGCAIYVGIDGNMQVATRGAPCTPAHRPTIEIANALLRKSLQQPTKKLLVNVCADLLSKAAKDTL